MEMYLKETGALSPGATIMAENSGSLEVVASAFNVAHQVIIDVTLPRHCGSLSLSGFSS